MEVDSSKFVEEGIVGRPQDTPFSPGVHTAFNTPFSNYYPESWCPSFHMNGCSPGRTRFNKEAEGNSENGLFKTLSSLRPSSEVVLLPCRTQFRN